MKHTSTHSLQRLLYSSFLSLFILTVFIFGLFILWNSQQNKLAQANETRYKTADLADELRQSSDDLTRMARTYVTTSDTMFKNQFYEVLNIRRGISPRPECYNHAYWDLLAIHEARKPCNKSTKISLRSLMQNAGFDKKELAIVSEVESLSDSLALFEIKAFNTFEGNYLDSVGKYSIHKKPNQQIAIALLFGEEYHKTKLLIMRKLNVFYSITENRTELEVASDKHKITLIGYTLLVVFFFVIVLFIIIFYINSKLKETIIEELSREVQYQTLELNERKQEIETQNEEYAIINDELHKTNDFIIESQNQMQNAKNYFEGLFNVNPDAIMITRIRDGKIMQINRALTDLFGYTIDDANEKSTLDMNVYVDPLERTRLINKIKENGRVDNFETILRRKDKSLITCLISASSIIIENEPIIIAVVRNISERKQSMLKVLESEVKLSKINKMLQIVIETIPVRLFWKDKNLTFLGCNTLFAFDAGLQSPHDLIGKTDFDMPWKNEADAFRNDDEYIISKGISKIGYEEQQTNYKGDVVWLKTTKVPLYDANNEIIGVLGAYEDITEQKKNDEAKRLIDEQIRRLSLAIEQSPVTTVITDLDGNIVFANPKFEETTGYTINEAIGKNPRMLKSEHTPSEVYKQMWETLTASKSWHGVLQNKKKNGEYYWESVVISPVKNELGITKNYLAVKEDISARIEAEQALHESNKTAERYLNVVSEIIIALDKNGDVTLINENGLKLIGYKKDEIIGKNWFKICLEGELITEISIVYKKLMSGELENIAKYEYEIITKSGERKTILWFNTILDDIYGNIIGVISSGEDITERNKNEELLRTQEDFLRVLTDNIPGMVAYWNNQLICEFANVSYLEWFGKTKNEMIGISMLEMMGNELFLKNKPNVDRALQGEKIIFERTLQKPNGEIGYTWAHYIPDVRNDEVRGFYVLVSDISDLKKAEIALHELSTRLKLATKAGGVGVWDFDLVNNKLLWDEQMYSLYGITKEEFGGAYEAWVAGVHPDDKVRGNEEIQMAISGEKEFDTEFRVLWPDGSVHVIKAQAVVQRDEFGNAINMIGTNWDITVQKQIEESLFQTAEQLLTKNNELDTAFRNAEIAFSKANEMAAEAEAANKSKSLFLANMSHEIRTPLNAIIGFSQLLSRDIHLTTSQREYNHSIIRAGEHLLELINDILELSKIEAGRVVLKPTSFDFKLFLTDIELIFKERTRAKHIQFLFETADDMPQYVTTDQSKLRQIFINLIGNAVKFTDQGGVAVRIKTLTKDFNKTHLYVEIQDSGPGIHELELKNLFKHFVQTSSGINKGSGTGLGLALSREIAILMGGDITVKSEVGVGSVFLFNVEIEHGKNNIENIATLRQIIGIENAIKKYKILVVDDKPENLKVVVTLLELIGFETNEAVNGQEAIETFKSWKPDLILMDIRMPIMDGYEATIQIKATDEGKRTPIVALTASTFEDERSKIETIGMQGYIRKPFKENELLHSIGQILNIKYIYKDEIKISKSNYQLNDEAVKLDISKLPNELLSQMLQCIEIADIDNFVLLIRKIDDSYSDLAKYLLMLASKYDYVHLQQLLKNDNQ